MITMPKLEEYKDAFFMPCNWPAGVKLGDGSATQCGCCAVNRAIFSSGARLMLCRAHTAILSAQVAERAARGGVVA